MEFWDKVEFTDYCWLYKGTINEDGYGMYNGKYVHRIAFEEQNNIILTHLELDHLCRNRRCCNPTHLELVTHKENILRGISPSAINFKKTHCPKGHEYNETNIYNYKNRRYCRKCRE